jgi:hypothetical protein
MKKATILIILIIFLFLPDSLSARRYRVIGDVNYSISFDYPIFYRHRYLTYKQVSLYQLSFESNWQSYRYRNTQYSLALNIGRYFSNIGTDNLYGIEYNVLFGRKNHFLEIGVGLDSELLTHAIIGYRFHLGQNVIMRFRFMPSTWFIDEHMNSSDENINYLDIGLSLAYRFGPRAAKEISIVREFVFDRLDAQFVFYPYMLNLSSEVRTHKSLYFDFTVYRNDEHQFVINFGTGNNIYRTLNIGSSYLYNLRNHQFEAGINFITSQKLTDYLLFQSQIGYRYHFKIPFFLRAAYVPYLRFEDWKMQEGLHHSIVFGVGYRFQK